MRKELLGFAGPLPNRMLVINEDSRARELAIHFGLIDALNDPGLPGPCGVRAVYYDHPTHWILVARAWRQTKASENGWCWSAYPKKGFPRKEFEASVFAGEIKHDG